MFANYGRPRSGLYIYMGPLGVSYAPRNENASGSREREREREREGEQPFLLIDETEPESEA